MLLEDLMLLYYPVNLLSNKHNYSYSKYHVMHMHSNSSSVYSSNISSSHSLPCQKDLELLIGPPLKEPI